MKNFLEIIKKKWLIDTSKTFILVALLIVVFLLINIGVSKLDLQNIDITKNKIYSLSDETKELIKDVKLNVTIYFFGVNEDYSSVDIAKQYSNINDKIKTTVVDYSKNPDIYEKYDITTSEAGIIVQAPERFKILPLDFVEYDYSTSESIDITEQELTNAIIDVTIAKKPKIYFLSGHNENEDIEILKTYLVNQINTVETLDLLSNDFPDDCDLLCIINPQKDFDKYETTKITDYINNGGNILWLSSGINDKFTNMKKVLSLYGASIPLGAIREINSQRTFLSSSKYFAPNILSHSLTKSFMSADTSSPLMALFDSSKINIVDDDELSKLNVTATPFIKSSNTSYFNTDLEVDSNSEQEGDETGPFTIGVEFTKTIDENTSKMILVSSTKFATDLFETSDRTVQPVVRYKNMELLLNTTAALTGREDSLIMRKSDNGITFSPTDSENLTILLIIFIVPFIIILLGIIVWIVRRRKR